MSKRRHKLISERTIKSMKRGWYYTITMYDAKKQEYMAEVLRFCMWSGDKHWVAEFGPQVFEHTWLSFWSKNVDKCGCATDTCIYMQDISDVHSLKRDSC